MSLAKLRELLGAEPELTIGSLDLEWFLPFEEGHANAGSRSGAAGRVFVNLAVVSDG